MPSPGLHVGTARHEPKYNIIAIRLKIMANWNLAMASLVRVQRKAIKQFSLSLPLSVCLYFVLYMYLRVTQVYAS